MKKPSRKPVVMLFRSDLRLADNPALIAAVESGQPVLPVLAWEEDRHRWSPGAVSRSWRLRNAEALDLSLKQIGAAGLNVLRGPVVQVLQELIGNQDIAAVHLNAGHDPDSLQEETQLNDMCALHNVPLRTHASGLLLPTGAILNKEGRAYRVFSAFHRRFLERYRHHPPAEAPGSIEMGYPVQQALSLEELLKEAGTESLAISARWQAGEEAARERLEEFIAHSLAGYGSERHSLEISGTSLLSAWLAVGAITSRQIWTAVEQALQRSPWLAEGAASFWRQLIWREFCCQILDEFPKLPDEPLQERFRAMPWNDNPQHLQAWCEGRTGYPSVDAPMRQLRQTGWMPGRARMIVGSFLVKHLLQPWQHGEAWFREHLIDYDLALNAFNWQWVAGSGADAAPYFRIFNPILQGRKFDPDGSYVRDWLPELAGLPDRVIHSPWTASPLELQAARIRLGEDYPQPIVEHSYARERALAALKSTSVS